MSDVRVSDLAKQATLKPNATTLLIQDDKTWQMSVTTLSASIYNAVMKSALSDTPIGQVSFFAMKDVVDNPTPPSGWFICDGREINISDFSELFAVIGTDFGTPSLPTKFKIPDLKNTFIKGWDGLDTSGTTTDSFINNSAGSTIAAWATFNGADTITSLFGSNISKVERYSEGIYKIYFTKPLKNVNYCVIGTSKNNTSATATSNDGYALCIPALNDIKSGDKIKDLNYFYISTYRVGDKQDSEMINILIVDDDEPELSGSTQRMVTFVPCIKYRNVVSSSTSVLPSLTIWDEGTKKGLITDLKVVGGNVKVDISGTIATLTVDTPTTITTTTKKTNFSGFETESLMTRYSRVGITSQPSIIGWGKQAQKNLDSYRNDIWPPVSYKFENNYLLKSTGVTVKKLVHHTYHTVCLLSDSTLWYFGTYQGNGRTGLGTSGKYTNEFKKLNQLITATTKIKDFEIITYNNVDWFGIYVITDDGKLYSWGLNKNGSLGLGDSSAQEITKPTLVDVDSKKVKEIISTNYYSESTKNKALALCEDGALYGVGINESGGLGVGDSSKKTKFTRCIKADKSLISNVKKVIRGIGLYYNSAFIDTNNDVYICGDANGTNQYSLGDGFGKSSRTSSLYYKKVNFPLDAGDSIIDLVISGSSYISCLALSKNGKMYSWGCNSLGDGGGLLGHGDKIDKKTPTLIDSMKSVKVQKIYACNVAGNYGAFGCIDNQGYAYAVGRNIPALENGYSHQSVNTNKFTQFPIKDVIDMRLYSDDNDNECGSVSLLDKEGRVFVIGESQGYSNGASQSNSTFTELNLTS